MEEKGNSPEDSGSAVRLSVIKSLGLNVCSDDRIPTIVRDL